MSSRTLFIGDVHGCAVELRLLLEQVQPNRAILVGDMFRKGPDNMGVWSLIQEWDLEAVIGNHDLAFLNTESKAYPKALRKWLKRLPIWIDGKYTDQHRKVKWRAVHAGVNPFKPKQTKREEAVTLRRYPNDSSEKFPFWWELYDKKRLVIYGHDARRGLQDHRPKTLGLDTGCVYGNGLTGYLLEEDRLIHVPSQQIYVGINS
jgi:hypothetical protein